MYQPFQKSVVENLYDVALPLAPEDGVGGGGGRRLHRTASALFLGGSCMIELLGI